MIKKKVSMCYWYSQANLSGRDPCEDLSDAEESSVRCKVSFVRSLKRTYMNILLKVINSKLNYILFKNLWFLIVKVNIICTSVKNALNCFLILFKSIVY